MVKAVSRYNKDRVYNMGKKMRNKSLIGSVLFALVLLAIGIYNIIIALSSEEGVQWLAIVLSVVIMGFSVYPIIKAINTNKKNVEETVKGMGLNRGELVLEFTFKEKRAEIVATQGDVVEKTTLMLRNVTNIKCEKDGIGIYIGDDLYYIENGDIVVGTREMLLNIFRNLGFNIKKK